ncbi:MAG: lipoyl(octanoyl) transferase [Solirubrobacterales bacterium]|jgi:lipoyl(octanoyl) transferase|nr:lipoyl(octanoyl) transferase [Solirubrobacterales bacterium]
MSSELLVARYGVVPYGEARELQLRVAQARQAEQIADVLLLLQHPPTYTRGRRSTAAELPMGEDWYRMQGIEVTETDRGGRVTYHGPGQLVGYPIVSLRPYGDDVHDYVRRMERVAIESLAVHGVEARTIEGLTGVWTAGERPGAGGAPGEARKIGSIGVHVSRGVTTHGFAINVNNDLQPFEWIVPCGIEGCRVTSLSRELGAEQDLDGFATTVRDRFAAIYERSAVEIEVAGLEDRLAAAELTTTAAEAAPVGSAQ